MDEWLLVVYRAGTEKSPLFGTITNDEVWLIKNPALYYPLDNQEAVKPTVCLWKAEINQTSLAIEDHPKFEGVCVVKGKRKVKKLPWKRSPVPHIQPGLSMMDSQVVSQAVLHFLIDNPPTTPEDFNFQAELKAASHWHWPKSDDEPMKLVSGPHDDLRVKMVAAHALKSWKEELRKASIQENTASSDLEECISEDESDDEPMKLVPRLHDDLHVKMVTANALKSRKEELRKASIQENTDSSDDLKEYISEDFNFQAELKAASHSHWLDDLHVKMVAAHALKSRKEELRDDDLKEYISDLEEVIFNLSMYYKGTLEETDGDNTASITSHNDDKRSKIEKRVSPRRKRKQSEEDYMNSPEKRSSQYPCTHSRLSIKHSSQRRLSHFAQY